MIDWESKPRYIISVAARMVGIEAHTLRYYEKLGLVKPVRSRGNIRLYSEEDIDRLRYIKTLMSDCGVNLAGVEVALRLMQRMKEMQQQLEEMESKIKKIAEARIEDIMEDIIEDAEWKEV
ncbi:MAG: MerR family DNA-binding transcriptional regulator [Chloroflexi bacterium]|nr:MAG: MerR family DNA-binding transcriptional regulator [Chloroflexota bacterium]